MDRLSGVAFVGEIDDDDEPLPKGAEADMLASMPLPGTPKDEAARISSWLKIPLRVRSAIRRLHRQFGHCPSTTLIQILKTGRADPAYVEAAKLMKCDSCEAVRRPKSLHPVALPKPYVFTHEVGVDCLEVADCLGKKYTLLNIVDQGTCYHTLAMVRVGGGTPSAATCFRTFNDSFVQWAGLPKVINMDRGPHNRG